jgi:hypothetical protein
LSDDPEVQKRLNKINQYLIEGYTDKEIYSMLQIPSSTYYNYKRQLHAEAAERFKEQRLDDLALHYDELKDRWTQLFRIGMEKINQSSKETMNPSKDVAGLFREIKILSKDICDLKVNTNIALHTQKRLPGADTTKSLPGVTDPEAEDEPDKSTDENPIV